MLHCIQKKKCRKDLISYRGIFHELKKNCCIIRKALQADVIRLGHERTDETVALICESCWFPNIQHTTAPVTLEPNMLPKRPWQKFHGDPFSIGTLKSDFPPQTEPFGKSCLPKILGSNDTMCYWFFYGSIVRIIKNKFSFFLLGYLFSWNQNRLIR